MKLCKVLFFNNYVTPFFLFMGVAITGISYGALFSVFPAITAEYYDTKNLGVNYGLVYISWGFAGVLEPLLAGRILDSTANYTLAHLLSAVLLIIAFICVLTFKSKSQISERGVKLVN